MKIIPVIDLKQGVAVHAKQGDREHYQPVGSFLCPSANIFEVIKAYLGLYDFDVFYIADLDAITGQGNHDALVAEVLARFPDKQFWVDRGYQVFKQQPNNYLPVLGTECYTEDTVNELKNFKQQFVLSLDYGRSGELGVKRLFLNSELWPEFVIIMTLARVGSQQGPDLNKLGAFAKSYADKKFVAAGGVRNLADLLALKQQGIGHVLLATSLHTGAVSAEEIAGLQ